MINTELLQRELDWLLQHPEQHRQGAYLRLPHDYDPWSAANTTEWRCGTAACLAGWTALHLGWLPVKSTYNSLVGDVPMKLVGGDELRSPHTVARDALGLTDRQALELFAGHNSLLELYQIAARLTDGRVRVPPIELFDEWGDAGPLAAEGRAWDQAAQVAVEALRAEGKTA